MKRYIKNLLKRLLFFIYKTFSRIGIHVLPVHYYSSIPDILELEENKEIWAYKSELPGLGVNLDEQIENLKRICLPVQSEYKGNESYNYAVKNAFGPGYVYIEAQALHAVIRHYKPGRVIEVGSGVSTWCMLEAAKLNKEEMGQETSITCIEPYPSAQLKKLNEINLIEEKVQSVAFDEAFSDLGENDFLFIDSSHTVKPGSDVNWLILEILPRLNPGVIVHFHDIYLPFDYSPTVLKTFFHWMETSMLRAYLAQNERAKCIFCQSHIHAERQDVLKDVFPEYNPCEMENGIFSDKYGSFENPSDEHFPSSIYIQV